MWRRHCHYNHIIVLNWGILFPDGFLVITLVKVHPCILQNALASKEKQWGSEIRAPQKTEVVII